MGNSFAVRDVRVFDGARAIEHANVIVRAGLVADVSTAPVPGDLAVIDGAGRTLIPGLIDAHAHVQSERGLRDALRFGVTTDLDMLTDVTFAQTHRPQRDGLLRTDKCDLWSAGVRGDETAEIHLKGRPEVLPVSRSYLHLFRQD